MLTRLRLPRGRCPSCGRDVALRKGGELREHGVREGRNAPVCVSSGQRPAIEGARDALGGTTDPA